MKQDVVNAVLWARRHCIGIRIRSGGHHYEGYSSGDFVLVIDISRLNAMSLEKKEDVLTIEAGAKKFRRI
ncbi:FAD-dependent oxidoreductase [Lysinibacillus sp. MHQ-1]|nr:FAD-dependent oxidoreductase [Lysinibacillus sp. MHQ-1]